MARMLSDKQLVNRFLDPKHDFESQITESKRLVVVCDSIGNRRLYLKAQFKKLKDIILSTPENNFELMKFFKSEISGISTSYILIINLTFKVFHYLDVNSIKNKCKEYGLNFGIDPVTGMFDKHFMHSILITLTMDGDEEKNTDYLKALDQYFEAVHLIIDDELLFSCFNNYLYSDEPNSILSKLREAEITSSNLLMKYFDRIIKSVIMSHNLSN